jgi:hypothetical protein
VPLMVSAGSSDLGNAPRIMPWGNELAINADPRPPAPLRQGVRRSACRGRGKAVRDVRAKRSIAREYGRREMDGRLARHEFYDRL